jgi:chromosome segregation ATPase
MSIAFRPTATLKARQVKRAQVFETQTRERRFDDDSIGVLVNKTPEQLGEEYGRMPTNPPLRSHCNSLDSKIDQLKVEQTELQAEANEHQQTLNNALQNMRFRGMQFKRQKWDKQEPKTGNDTNHIEEILKKTNEDLIALTKQMELNISEYRALRCNQRNREFTPQEYDDYMKEEERQNIEERLNEIGLQAEQLRERLQTTNPTMSG